MISHEHKCIFIHVPKTAGMSILSFFYPDVQFKTKRPDYEKLFGWCPKRRLHMQHATAKQLLELELVTQEQWNDYFKFTFVRNPWDRAYSDYKFIQKFSGVTGGFSDFINKSGPFYEILNNDNSQSYLGDHLLPQTSFFDLEGEYQLNFVGAFENFHVDIDEILKKLNIIKNFDIHINKSKRKVNYANFYTRSMENLVATKYIQDIKILGYHFDNNRTGLNKFKKYL
ncbi:sulfotransferase family 2 domain-containing protein [Aestuariibaculum marinum]|uniref:Sulfotransferase family 2 domain-containing protein n=1 Tax=Aestuariibaculum marinum TaxID=2683592 RepID=A0A8J6PT41_9FLAO|nr:sulfotransferase family 2 domain-containing protein [Aestuariibaculum marinum]MBD0823864.1 sulfotransferase family 2 domain-containing protein [Aestuariibaculum marinum]